MARRAVINAGIKWIARAFRRRERNDVIKILPGEDLCRPFWPILPFCAKWCIDLPVTPPRYVERLRQGQRNFHRDVWSMDRLRVTTNYSDTLQYGSKVNLYINLHISFILLFDVFLFSFIFIREISFLCTIYFIHLCVIFRNCTIEIILFFLLMCTEWQLSKIFETEFCGWQILYA